MIKEQIVNLIFSLNWFIFLLNLFIFIFSKQIIEYLDTSDLEWKNPSEHQIDMMKRKRKFLIIINSLIFLWYFISLFFKLEVVNKFIAVLAVILFAFLIWGLLIRGVVSIYWEKIDINGETYIKKWYKTRIFSLLTIILVVIVTFYAVIDVLWFQSWLQNGWFIWWLLAFLWFTAPVWATDMFSSILILHSWKIDLWDVIKFEIDGEKKIAFIKHINLSDIMLVDLVYWNPILIRSSAFRNLKIVNLSRNIVWQRSKNIKQIIEAKIWYEFDLEQIKELFNYAFTLMLENEENKKYFPEDILNKIDVQIKDFWDFAVVYQLIYEISSPFYIIKANRLLNIYLQKAQKKFNIEFSTPELFVEQKCN